MDPGPVAAESALSEVAKLPSLRAIGLPADLFQGLRRRIVAESPSQIRQHLQAIRRSLLSRADSRVNVLLFRHFLVKNELALTDRSVEKGEQIP